ncbi:hypothetical protein V1514DRAFT_334864 [Lipomyces japonicus]|uniref:uncharacterized protein n=1 Tax=Lipomyces japonicus TaxID=56871 RepID=UPI0034CF76BF
MGGINLHVISMSLRSLIPGEIKVALDALLLISVDQHVLIPVTECEDIVDGLVDVGEDAIERIAKIFGKNSEVLPEFDSYEDMVLAAKEEYEGLTTAIHSGSPDYELEILTGRLSAVTTIMRNLTFYEQNQEIFARPTCSARRFWAVLMRAVANTGVVAKNASKAVRLAIVKDVVVVLSNVAHETLLDNSDEALWVLSLVAAFAPAVAPTPAGMASGAAAWPAYVPSKQRYLQLAVDVLAKMLARETPNIDVVKAVITATATDAATITMNTGLAMTLFRLCMSTFPRQTDPSVLPRAFEVRRPVLEQAMFAADVLARILLDSTSRQHDGDRGNSGINISSTNTGDNDDSDMIDVEDWPVASSAATAAVAASVTQTLVPYLNAFVRPFLIRAATVLSGFVQHPPSATAPNFFTTNNNTTTDLNPFSRVVRKAAGAVSKIHQTAGLDPDSELEMLVLRM